MVYKPQLYGKRLERPSSGVPTFSCSPYSGIWHGRLHFIATITVSQHLLKVFELRASYKVAHKTLNAYPNTVAVRILETNLAASKLCIYFQTKTYSRIL